MKRPFTQRGDGCDTAALSVRTISCGNGRLSQSMLVRVSVSVADEIVALSFASMSGLGTSAYRLIGSKALWT